MRKTRKKPEHFANGLIAEYRNSAAKADTDLLQRALKESKKAKAPVKSSVFSKLSARGAKKLLAF